MVDGGEPGVDSRDEGKHTGRNDHTGVAVCLAQHALSPTHSLNDMLHTQPDTSAACLCVLCSSASSCPLSSAGVLESLLSSTCRTDYPS